MGNVINRALITVGIELVFDPPIKKGSGGSNKPMKSVSVNEMHRFEAIHKSVADYVRIYCRLADKYVPACEFRDEVHRARNAAAAGSNRLQICISLRLRPTCFCLGCCLPCRSISL